MYSKDWVGRLLGEGQEDEEKAGHEVQQIVPLVVDQQVGWQSFMAMRMRRQFIIVDAFLKEDCRFSVYS